MKHEEPYHNLKWIQSEGTDKEGRHLWEKMSSANMTGEEIRKALQEAIQGKELKAKTWLEKIEEPEVYTSGYLQVVPDSHRYTIYGLKMELERLRDILSIQEQMDVEVGIIDHILTGIENSIKAGTDQSTVI